MTKKLILGKPLLAMAIFGLAVFSAGNVLAVEQPWCTDSDGGINYFQKGIIDFYPPIGSISQQWDYCMTEIPGGQRDEQCCSGADCRLHEFYCDNAERKGDRIPLPVGFFCELGALKQSSDGQNHVPTVTLLGQNPMNLTLGSTFTDPGAQANDPEEGDLTSRIKVLGAVNTSATGTYPLTYSVHDSGGLGATTTRQVFVVVQQSAQCSDGIDNDQDGKIDSEDVSCHTDKNPNNPGSYAPSQDTENFAPVIILNGSDLTLSFGSTFTDPGYTAADFEDGDITSKVVVGGGPVNTNDAGPKTLTYNVKDSQNAPASEKTRQVMVQKQSHGGGGGGGGGSVISLTTVSLVITNEQVQDLGNGTALITWKTNNPATSKVAFGTSSVQSLNLNTKDYGYASSTQETNVLVVSHAVLVKGLKSGLQYYFRSGSDNPSSNPVVGLELSLPQKTTATTPVVIQSGVCTYLLEFLKIGQANNPVEVKKLQNFLNQFESAGLAVNGFFGQETFDAVSAFQTKYFNDVLAPWGYLEPTGYVYITTKKKINELYYQRPFPLTTDQMAEIEAFKAMFGQAPESISTSTIGQAPKAGQIAGTIGQPTGEAQDSSATTEQGQGLAIDESGLLADVNQPTGQEPEQEIPSLQEEGQEFGALTVAGLGGVVQSKLIYLLALILAVLILFSVVLFFRAKRRQEVPYSIPPFPENIPTA